MKLSWVSGSTLFLLICEAALRWGVGLGDPPLARLDPSTQYELVPSAEYSRWGNRIAINEYGLRAPGLGEVSDLQRRVILLIGDSVVYGGHFLDQSETIAARMTQKLRSIDRLAGCQPLVLPVAVSSWGPANQAAYLRREGSFGAQTAGIIVSAHDLYDVPESKADILPYRLRRPYTAIEDAFTAVFERTRQAPAPVLTRAERAQVSIDSLSELAEILAVAGVSLVVIYHPTVSERQAIPRPEKERFEDWARSRGLEFVDLGNLTVNPGDYRDSIHPSASGAASIAASLMPVLSTGLSNCNNS